MLESPLLPLEDDEDDGSRCGDSSVILSEFWAWESEPREETESWGGLCTGGDDPGVRLTMDCSDTFGGGALMALTSISGFGNLITRIRVGTRDFVSKLLLCTLRLFVG